jgi:hypothetical protein
MAEPRGIERPDEAWQLRPGDLRVGDDAEAPAREARCKTG